MGSIEKYLEWRWKRYNHRKYHKYYSQWREGITKNQLYGISKQMKKDMFYQKHLLNINIKT